MTLDFESDQFLKLLTDALRDGPGSPHWHEAITRLRAGDGGVSTDEYQLLCEAREHLESGKAYRSVRPGPAFTRKVMNAIDVETFRTNSSVPTANAIAVIAALLIVGALVALAYVLIPRGAGVDSAEVDRLAATLLGNPVTSTTFAKGPPADWQPIGRMRLDYLHGMHPSWPTGTSKDPSGGGLVWATPVLSDEPFALEATLRVNRTTDDLLPEIAVSDEPDFSHDNATASHELVWLLQSGIAKVILPQGRIEGQTTIAKGPHDPLHVRMLVNRTTAVVELDGKRLWAGAHGLDGDKPRYLAIRLIRRGSDKQDQIAFESVRVLK